MEKSGFQGHPEYTAPLYHSAIQAKNINENMYTS